MSRPWLLSVTALAVLGSLAAFWSLSAPADADPAAAPPPAAQSAEGKVDAVLDLPGRHALTPMQAAQAREGGLLPAGAKSLLDSEGQLAHGDFLWDEKGVPAGEIAVWVDLRRQLVSVFRGGHEIGSAVILYGTDGHETPLGSFAILSKHRDYHSRSYDAPMPHSLFLTDDGVALHGSSVEQGRATHGCVGLPLEFARLLFDQAAQGDVVTIVRSDASLEEQSLAGLT